LKDLRVLGVSPTDWFPVEKSATAVELQ